MALLKHPKIEQLEQGCLSAMREDLTDNELFSIARFDEEEVERTGVSNYSYWRSTVRAFTKNKAAMFMLTIMVIIVLFTFIQPLLPNQFDPFTANNDANGLPLRNQQPGGVHWLGTNQIGQDLWAAVERYAQFAVYRHFRRADRSLHRHHHRRAVGLRPQAGFPLHGNLQCAGQHPLDDRPDPDLLHPEARYGHADLRYVADGLDRHGTFRAQSGADHPGP